MKIAHAPNCNANDGGECNCDNDPQARLPPRRRFIPALDEYGREIGRKRPGFSLRLAKPEHEVAYQDLCALVSRHASRLSALELLAIAANMLGKLVALQDQRSVSPAEAMGVVAQNIEHGNKQVLDQLAQSKGGA